MRGAEFKGSTRDYATDSHSSRHVLPEASSTKSFKSTGTRLTDDNSFWRELTVISLAFCSLINLENTIITQTIFHGHRTSRALIESRLEALIDVQLARTRMKTLIEAP